MLTAAQVQVVAFQTPWGEMFCSECTHSRLDDGGGPDVEGFEPVIQYSLDEYQAETEFEREDYPECSEECSPMAIDCESCGAELLAPYHAGHEVNDD